MDGDRWVLVTDGGTGQARSTLAAVRALGAAGYRPAVTVSGPYSLAGASRFCRRRVEVPPVGDPGFEGAVREEIQSRPYVAVLPASDAAILALGAEGRQFVDKRSLAELARAAHVPIPPTRTFASRQELLEDSADLDYPVVVKSVHSFVTPAFRVERRSDVMAAPMGEGPLLVQPFVGERLRAIAGVVWEGRLVAAVHQRYHRTWPRDCGTASAAETVEPDVAAEERLITLLCGYQGIFQAQFAGDLLLDLNPRVYGSLSLAVSAGANLPAVWCDLVTGRPVERMVRARPGVFYRWVEGDVRHVFGALCRRQMRAGEAFAALRPRRRTAHSTESLTDPAPTLARLGYAARRGR